MSFDDWDSEVIKESNPLAGEMICASLEEKKYQTLRHLAINTGLSPDDIEPWLKVHTEKVWFQMVGTLEVWYLRKNKPDGRLFNTGYNSFGIVSGTILTVEKPKRRKDSAPLPKTIGIRASISDKLPLEDVERWGFEGKTIREVARLAGITDASATFYLYSKDYPYRAAFRRGKEKRKNLEKVKEVEAELAV